MIRLTRLTAYTDKLRAYKIFIDDVYRGDIKQNQTKEFAVDNGSHTIHAEIDWCKSNRLSVDVDNSIVELEISPSLSGGKLLIPFSELWQVTAGKDQYLQIKQK